MIKFNQVNLSLGLLEFNKTSQNDSSPGVGNKTIPNGGNTAVGISVHYNIPLYFGRAFHGDQPVLFNVN